ncbi:TPA: hypothetical protein H1016_05465 [archaeon]|uniref:Uncharacterized protein n=1 Tax=Candidatus Naiadarchaeum limnaeum TaxID=2756139 RepID=A0A832XIM1_9ARCH|nr:hypothetical protein [Candidatus Naiadarchaeum limnaeum]
MKRLLNLNDKLIFVLDKSTTPPTFYKGICLATYEMEGNWYNLALEVYWKSKVSPKIQVPLDLSNGHTLSFIWLGPFWERSLSSKRIQVDVEPQLLEGSIKPIVSILNWQLKRKNIEYVEIFYHYKYDSLPGDSISSFDAQSGNIDRVDDKLQKYPLSSICNVRLKSSKLGRVEEYGRNFR